MEPIGHNSSSTKVLTRKFDKNGQTQDKFYDSCAGFDFDIVIKVCI